MSSTTIVGVLAVEPTAGPITGLITWLITGLILGLSICMSFGLLAILQHYVLRFWLWHTSIFPFRVVAFLEDTRARHLLRRVGGSYQFTHRLL